MSDRFVRTLDREPSDAEREEVRTFLYWMAPRSADRALAERWLGGELFGKKERMELQRAVERARAKYLRKHGMKSLDR